MRHRYDWGLVRAKAKMKAWKVGFAAKRHQNGLKTFAQVGLGVVALIGISMYSVPIALIIAGVVGIVAIERN